LPHATARQQLRREQQALLVLRHRNIVRVLDAGEDGSDFFMAMEPLSGVTAEVLLQQRGPIGCGHAAQIAGAVADALVAVHDAGVVHRDVKCSNIMILDEDVALPERVKLIDFGAAAAGELDDESRQQILGTLPYLAPEVIEYGLASPASDIYALGVTLYTMSTGRQPFSGSSKAELLRNIRAGRIPDLSAIVPSIDPAIVRAIGTALAGAPEDRWASAAEMRDILAAVDEPHEPLVLPATPLSFASEAPTRAEVRDDTE